MDQRLWEASILGNGSTNYTTMPGPQLAFQGTFTDFVFSWLMGGILPLYSCKC